MKHLLNGLAIAAVLAIAAPGWAQTNPPPAEPPTTASPPAATAPSSEMTPPAAPSAAAPAAAAPEATAPEATAPAKTQPMKKAARGHHGHARHYARRAPEYHSMHHPMHHRMAMRHHYRGRHERAAMAQDSMANQLNRQELDRLQGAAGAPPEPAMGTPPQSGGMAPR